MIPQGQWSSKKPAPGGSSPPSAARSGEGAAGGSQSSAPQQQQAATSSSSTTTTPATGLQSCQFCRKRKIKCDKALPKCSHCVRAQTPCVYPPSQRRGRPRIAAKHKPPSSTPREDQLLKKIKRLETVIETLRGSGDDGEQSDTDPVRQRLGRLVVGKPYVNDTFWASNEIKDLLGNGDDDSDSGDDDSSSLTPIVTSSHMRRHNFLFSVDMTNQDLSGIHPPPWQIPKYWQLYYQNFEIVMRFQHQPAAKRLMEEAQENIFNLTKSKEVLLFSMYFAAVSSLSDEEAPIELGAEKAELLAKYEDGIRRGLQKAEFLHTQDLMVLIAFAMYLSCIRHSDGAIVWTLTGLALRIAEGLGIHRDGKLFGLPPFEVEMRRRVWHNIMILDVRASEARGCLPTFIYSDTELPLRINETDLHPDMKQEPQERSGLTDMSVALIRYEMSQVGRTLLDNPFQTKPLSLQAKEKTLNGCMEKMQRLYLEPGEREDASPLTRFACAIVRLVVARMFLMIYQYQNGESSQDEKDRLFLISLNILELSIDIKNDPCAKRWGYLFRAHIQWHAIATLLKELAVRPRSQETDRAWRIVDKNSPDWTVANDSPDNVMSLSVKKLLSKAQAHREETYKHEAFDSTATLSEFTQYHTEAEEQPPFLAQSTFQIPSQYAYMPQPQPQQQFQIPFHTTMEMQQPIPFQYVPIMPTNQITSYIFEPPSFDEMDMSALPTMTEEPWNPWGVDMSADYRYKGV